MTNKTNAKPPAGKAPTDAEMGRNYAQAQADAAAALLASLPKRRVRTRKVTR